MRVAAREQRRADAADLVAQRRGHRAACSDGERVGEEVRAAEVAGLQREVERRVVAGRRARRGPRHAGRDLRADGQLPDAERLDDRARGLAAGDDEAAHAALRPGRARSRASASSTSAPARMAPSACCTAATASGAAVAYTRTGPCASRGPAQRSASPTTSSAVPRGRADRSRRRRRPRRRSAPPARWSPTNSCPTPPHAAPVGRRQRVGPHVGRQRAGRAPVLRQADRDPRARGDESQVGEREPDRHQVVVRDRVDDRDADAVGPQRRAALGDRARSARDRCRTRRGRPCGASARCSTRTRLASVIGVSG